MADPGPVAIVGAGLSGLSCARALGQAGIEVHVFERAGRVGGRCATRLWQGHLVDHGAQYFTAHSAEFKRELLTNLHQFRPLIAPILDFEGKVVHSRTGPRFYAVQGNNFLPHVLSGGLDVRLGGEVKSVAQKGDGFACPGGNYRVVVSSLPAPQTARLFGLEQNATPYFCCLTVLLEYDEAFVGDSRDCYARVLPDGSEPLAASYCENHKTGRVLGAKTVFVLQAGHAFSAAHADAPLENYLPQLVRAHEELWRISGHSYTARFAHRWRFAFPDPAGRQALRLPPGAFACGDSFGEPTLEGVWLDGRRAAEEVGAYFKG